MKITAPLLFWFLSLAAFVATGLWSHSVLPDQVASHFNASGQADDWMGKGTFLSLMVGLGVGVTALMSVLMYLTRFMPSSLVRAPHAKYWRQKENFQRACAYFFRSSLWFGGFFFLWWVLFLRVVTLANLKQPPTLDGLTVIVLIVVMALVMAGWSLVMYRHFLKVPKLDQSA